MSERHDEALSELRDLLCDLRRAAEECSYGNFLGGDPRNFDPDPECSTDDERENHRRACDAWDKGERPQHVGCHWASPDIHVMATPFGLGTNVLQDPQAADWAERLDRCLARLEQEP